MVAVLRQRVEALAGTLDRYVIENDELRRLLHAVAAEARDFAGANEELRGGDPRHAGPATGTDRLLPNATSAVGPRPLGSSPAGADRAIYFVRVQRLGKRPGNRCRVRCSGCRRSRKRLNDGDQQLPPDEHHHFWSVCGRAAADRDRAASDAVAPTKAGRPLPELAEATGDVVAGVWPSSDAREAGRDLCYPPLVAQKGDHRVVGLISSGDQFANAAGYSSSVIGRAVGLGGNLRCGSHDRP